MNPGNALILEEIATAISESLARYGVAGDVYISGGELAVLEGSGPRATTPIGTLAQHWDLLPHDERQRRSGELARRLVEARRSGVPFSTSNDNQALAWVVRVAGASVLLLGILAAYKIVGPKARTWLAPAAPSSAEPAAPLPPTDELRARRVCDAAAARALRGATLGAADVEGWQVDIHLIRPGSEVSPIDDVALTQFVQGPSELRKLVWAGARSLAAAQGAGSSLELEDFALPPTLKPRFRGLSITFSGRFVTPYFNEATRGEYMQLGQALSDALKAEYAGVFAHCVGSKEKLAGAWFRAPSPALAASALIYFMGVDAAIPHVRQDLMRPSGGMLDYSFALENVRGATRGLTYEDVRTSIGNFGGSIAGGKDGPTTLLFDFKDSGRSTRASRELAHRVGLDDGH